MASEAASVGSQRLSDTVVDRVASEHMRELVSCLGGESAHGARVRFRVRADGSVVRARVAMPGNPPRVRGCIEREVETWHFPPQPASDVPGAYTLSFR